MFTVLLSRVAVASMFPTPRRFTPIDARFIASSRCFSARDALCPPARSVTASCLIGSTIASDRRFCANDPRSARRNHLVEKHDAQFTPTPCLFNDLTCFVRDVGSGMTLRTIDYSSRVVSNTWLLDDQVAVYDWLVMSLLHLFAHLLRLIA